MKGFVSTLVEVPYPGKKRKRKQRLSDNYPKTSYVINHIFFSRNRITTKNSPQKRIQKMWTFFSRIIKKCSHATNSLKKTLNLYHFSKKKKKKNIGQVKPKQSNAIILIIRFLTLLDFSIFVGFELVLLALKTLLHNFVSVRVSSQNYFCLHPSSSLPLLASSCKHHVHERIHPHAPVDFMRQ